LDIDTGRDLTMCPDSRLTISIGFNYLEQCAIFGLRSSR